MVEEQSLLIGELAQQTGISVRTIRYYIEEGLLPSPRVQGKYTVYDEEYINRIKLIRFLKDTYLPLKEIRRVLDQLGEQETKDLLAQYERGESPMLPPAPPTPATTPGSGNAVDYIANVLKSRADIQQKVAQTPQRLSSLGTPVPFATQSTPDRQSSPPQANQPSGSTWRRIPLAPGVELHIEEPAEQKLNSRIDRLVAFAKKVFQ